jgi:hypothetical protein
MVINNLKTILTTTIYLSKGKQRKMSIEASLLALMFKINKEKAKKYISKTCGELAQTQNQIVHKVKELGPSISSNQEI